MSGLRILCIGDSITQGGVMGRDEWTYRLPLQEMLRAKKVEFDFIGSRRKGAHETVQWPDVDGVPFDPGHEGYYGWPTADVAEMVRRTLPGLPPPDVALVHLGTNDQRAYDYQAAVVAPLEGLVARLRVRSPKVAVFVGHLCFNFGPALEIRPLVEEMTTRLNTPASPVEAVHHYRDWTEDPASPNSDTFDWVHPNPAGQRRMAVHWLAAMKSKLAALMAAVAMIFGLLSGTTTATAAAADELAVETNFEGASARVVSIDQQERSIRFEPGGDPRQGWPCWWHFRIRGVRTGETLTLRLRAVDALIPQTTYSWVKGKPLGLEWSAPSRAAWSSDEGETWQRTERGTREAEWMVYRLKAGAEQTVMVAWGPAYTPTRAGEFARVCAEKHPAMVKAESLSQSREGRAVPLLRIAEGPLPVSKRGAIWVHARQHAWESGSSWVAQGFTEWLLGESAEAAWLRQQHEIIVVPVMDVDHVANGQGGKEAIPQDHNRDWSDRPHWPEVAAAQTAIRAMVEAGRLRAFIDLHNPGPGNRLVQFHTPPDEGTKPGQRAMIDRFHQVALTHLAKVMPVEETVLKSGANYDPTWKRMSASWVAANAPESTLPVCIETPWNIERSTQEGYRAMGAAIGVTLYHHLREGGGVGPRL